MYNYIENDDDKIGLHDCRVIHMDHNDHILSFDFAEGFYILNQEVPIRFKNSRMECHILDEDIDGISIYI